MAMPVWPAGLPYQSEREQYGVPQLGSPLIKSEMQSGRVRQRRQFTARIALMKWGRSFKPGEMAVFHTFIFDTLAGGAADFTMPVWNAGLNAYVERSVQIENGAEGIAEQDAGTRTMVTMTLRVRDL